MSWHFLQEQEAASWGGQSLDGAPDALLRLIPTPALYFSPDSETGCSPDFRCGMTSKPSTAAHGEAISMSSQEGSRARTSAIADISAAFRASEADSGEKWPESLARYDRDTSSWRTSQRCFIEEWYFERRQKVAPDLPVMVALKTPPTPEGFYGRLNPDWCEWLMGFPVGWTRLGSLGMDRFLSWQQQHGESCPVEAAA